MGSSRALAHLLNLRQNEARAAAIAFFSCLLCVFFLILGSAMRDSLYFTSFKVETLPYATGGVVLLGLPFSALLTRMYSKHHPLVVF
ncbi:MAG TPA: hypothetical protein VJP40_09715, partial [bacterium]|nr:hypothetical protein [bacterium]